MTEKEKKAKEYKEKFERLLAETDVIYTRKKDEYLVLDENIKWKQVYKADDEARKVFPNYWFLDNEGHLASICGKKISLIKSNFHDATKRYKEYIYYINENDELLKRKVYVHQLVAIVFNSLYYGKAKKKLQNDGLNGFGLQDDCLNVHHIDCNKNNNNIENLELLTKQTHYTMNAVPEQKKADKKNFSYMKRLSDIVADEKPNKITMYVDLINIVDALGKFYYDGSEGYKSIHAVNEITLSKNAIKEAEALRVKLADKYLIKAIADELLKEKGQQYFDDKAFFTNDNFFFKCVYNEKADSIEVHEISNIVELAEKKLVKCSIDNDRYQILEL